MRDVTVYPPPATWGKTPTPDFVPTPDEIIQMQTMELRRLRSELAETKIAANAFANVAAWLIYQSEQTSDDPQDKMEVVVPRWFETGNIKKIRLECGRVGDEIFARYTMRADGHNMVTRGV